MKRILFILYSLICAFTIHAQTPETIIVGDIYDAYTGEALPNVNIYLQGTTIGTMSNPEGMFLLRGSIDKAKNMVVSAVGYQTERFRIEAGQQVGVQIGLKEKIGNLGEVFVTPGVNPALALMDHVRRNRETNEQSVDIQQANMQTALYVSDIQSKHLQRSLWKDLQTGMLHTKDSTYLIPLYWRNQQGEKVEEKATLLTVTDYQVLLNQLHTTCNFYNNHINILSTSLLSPLAASGNSYYNYYLADSIYAGDEKHYIVHFRTKNAFYATFNGEMAIDSASYALRRIEASVPAQTSVNYLRKLTINQSYTPDNYLEKEDIALLLDFAIKADTSHIFPTLFLTRSAQMPFDQNPTISDISLTKKDTTPSMIINAMDSVDETPLFKTAKFLAYVLQTGCIPTNKYVEIGKIHHVFKLNYAEGLRIGIPLQTTEALWKNVSLEGFLAYGTKDRAWKGMGQVSVQFPSERRHIMRLRYSDEYSLSDVSDFQLYLRENNILSQQINIVTRLMQGVPFNPDYYYNTMVRRREGRIHFENDWNKHLETQAYLKVGRTGYGLPTTDYAAQPSFFQATLGAAARVSFGERKVDSYFHRRHIYNHLPIIYLGAELGSYQTMHMPSYQMYGNIHLMVRHNVDLGLAGNLEYLLQGGMIFGKVPYPLLHIFASNQTHAFDNQRFTLMNTYQYAADRYVALQALWDGKGILFNLIPGLRYLRLRELVEMKIAYGSLSKQHQSVLAFPTLSANATGNNVEGYTLLNAPTKPYIELGVGIGNILRIGEVYGVFRLTNIDDPYCPWWAVRFRLSLGL